MVTVMTQRAVCSRYVQPDDGAALVAASLCAVGENPPEPGLQNP